MVIIGKAGPPGVLPDKAVMDMCWEPTLSLEAVGELERLTGIVNAHDLALMEQLLAQAHQEDWPCQTTDLMLNGGFSIARNPVVDSGKVQQVEWLRVSGRRADDPVGFTIDINPLHGAQLPTNGKGLVFVAQYGCRERQAIPDLGVVVADEGTITHYRYKLPDDITLDYREPRPIPETPTEVLSNKQRQIIKDSMSKIALKSAYMPDELIYSD